MTSINNKRLCRISLGTASFSSGDAESDAFRLIDTYRDAGGNILDTARVYGDSEGVIGRYLALRKCRDELIISTKGGHYDLSNGRKRINAREISEDLECSLSFLGTDYVDIYWLHRDDEDIPAGEIMEMLCPLVRSGKVLSLGASNWSAERISEANTYAELHGIPKITASQIKHSAAVTVSEIDPTIRSLDDTSRPFYKKEKMPIFAFTSQAKGLFTKLAAQGENGIPDSLRREFICNETLRRAKEISVLAESLGATETQVALALLLCDPDVSVIPIIGGRTSEQIMDSMAAIAVQLTHEQYNTIMKGHKKA